MARLKGQSLIVKDYLTKFKDIPRAQLARIIYKENKQAFTNVEAVRSCIRYNVGQLGAKKRKDISSTSDFDVARKSYYDFLPKSFADVYEPFIIKQSKILNISDLHFPYQDNEAIKLALKYGVEKKVDCVLINGDLVDFAGISRHEKDWRQRSVHEELEAVRTFLKGLRKLFPKQRIVFKYGNHDERWEKYLFLKAPELFGCTDFELPVLLKLGELKIEVVKEKRPIKVGKLTILHGHELAGSSGGVNPARATFLKTLDSVIVGHYHKRSSHDETTMNGNVISVQSQGCLCGMNPLYMPINKWQQGFSYIEHDIKSGDYMLHNHVIIKGKVF